MAVGDLPTDRVEPSASSPAGLVQDRPARIRAALRRLVADRGFHGASMQAVAQEAGVATGTAYVHYTSKDELVIDAYREAKHELLAAAVDGVSPTLPPLERFLALWRNLHRHLAEAPERARFLLQVEVSPYGPEAHRSAMADLDGHGLVAGTGAAVGTAAEVGARASTDPVPDPVSEALADVADRFVDLPPLVQFDLVIGPAIRLVASGERLDDAGLDRLARACWRAAIDA